MKSCVRDCQPHKGFYAFCYCGILNGLSFTTLLCCFFSEVVLQNSLMCEKCSQRILVHFECTPVWTTATAVEKAADGLRDVYRDLYLQNELLGKRKGKEEYLYSAFLHQGTHNALRHGSHSFTCKQHHACLSFVAFTRCHHHSN